VISRAVGAEVHEYHHVAVLHAHRLRAGRDDGCGLDKLIVFVAGVGRRQSRFRTFRLEFRLAPGEQVIAGLDAQPALVAVHDEVAADNGGDLPHLELVALFLESAQIELRASWRRVATIEESVQVDFLHPGAGGQFEHGVDVCFVAMHAAIGEQSQYVQCLAVASRGFRCLGQGGIGEEMAAADGAIDAGEFLVDDTAGADVEVADLGVAHLSARQSHRRFGRIDGGVGAGLPEFIPVGFVRAGDGIVILAFAATESIQNNE